MRKFFIGLLAVLMMTACSDGVYDDFSYDSQPGYTSVPTLISFDGNLRHPDLSDFQIECIRESDSAQMTLSDCYWYEVSALDEPLDSTQTMLYVSWMDMDALMSNKQTIENYHLRMRCPTLWGDNVREIVWNLLFKDKKAYPQYYILKGNETNESNYDNLDGNEMEVSYVSISGMQTPYITITLQ